MTRRAARLMVVSWAPSSSSSSRYGMREPQVAGGGGHDGLEGQPPGGAAAGLAAAAAAVQVQPLLAGGLPGHRDGLQQGAQVADAGQCGQSFQVRAGCAAGGSGPGSGSGPGAGRMA